MAHKGPNSERNLYGSPQPSALGLPRRGEGRRICGPDRHINIVRAGQ